jgi:hypothetical protein
MDPFEQYRHNLALLKREADRLLASALPLFVDPDVDDCHYDDACEVVSIVEAMISNAS